MSIERKHTNARMSHIVVDGGTVYLAGQVAREGSGDTVADQTRDILARIDELLAEAGSDRTRLLTTTIWLKDIATFDEMNSVWDKWVPEGRAPAVRPSRPRSRRRGASGDGLPAAARPLHP